MNKILSQPKLERYFTSLAKKFGARFKVDYKDLLSNFYLELLSGHHAEFEHTAYGYVRAEYKRGLTGATDIPTSADFDAIANILKSNSNFLDSHELIEYLYDLKRSLSEKEYQLVVLHLAGHNKQETYDQTRDAGIPRREFHKIWTQVIKFKGAC